MPTWIVIDAHAGAMVRFYHPSLDGTIALKNYIRSTNLNLTSEEAFEATKDFDGEIWNATDMRDIELPEGLIHRKRGIRR